MLPQASSALQSPTPPFLSIAIPELQKRMYQKTVLTPVRQVGGAGAFSGEIISYTVDGLKEYALVDVPTTSMPKDGFPVVVVNHGYIIPSQYDTVISYAQITNFFAKNGYIVLKPDYRGNGNSQGATDPLQRYNYPVDVLTLLASVKNIPQANPAKIYLWGHSMGGEVTLTVLEILGSQPNLEKDVKAAVLWAPVTDPAQWFGQDNLKKIPEAQLTPFPYSETFSILGMPSDNSPIWQSINPMRFLSSIHTPVQINHGTSDVVVPYSWSVDLVRLFKAQGNQVEFVSYPDADHNLAPLMSEALQNNLTYFQAHQ